MQTKVKNGVRINLNFIHPRGTGKTMIFQQEAILLCSMNCSLVMIGMMYLNIYLHTSNDVESYRNNTKLLHPKPQFSEFV